MLIVNDNNSRFYLIKDCMKKNALLSGLFSMSVLYAMSQTTLQQVTDAGSTTTNGISIRNSQGLNIGVDAESGYTTQSHYIKPSPDAYRTVRFDCSSMETTGGWEFYNSESNRSLAYIKQSGNMGIGTTNPVSQLHLASNSNHSINLSRSDGTYGFRIYRDAYSEVILFQIGTTAAPAWETKIQIGEGEGTNTPLLFNPGGGNIGVGTLSPQEKLSVNGNVLAKKVRVSQSWADYVFDPAYLLKPLAEVDNFIQANKHLPGMPSAKEIEAKGLDLGEITKQQQVKIEELTLYAIRQDKNKDVYTTLLAEQQKLIDQQQQRMEKQDKELKELQGVVRRLLAERKAG